MSSITDITNFEIFRWRSKTSEYVTAGAAIIKHDTALPAGITGDFFIGVNDINGNPISAYVPAGAATDTQLGTTLKPLQWQPATGTDIDGAPSNGGDISNKQRIVSIVDKVLLLQTMQALEGLIGSTKKFNAAPLWDTTKPNVALTVPEYQNEVARDASITTPVEGMKVKLINEGKIMSYIGGDWADEGTSTTPNASESVAGKAELATLAEQGSHAETGSTGAKLVLQSKNTVKEAEIYNPAYLTGGNNAEGTFNNWTPVTDGEFAITIDGVVRNVIGLNFSAVTDMDDVADIIQAGIIALTSGTETCVWSTNHFVISSADTTSSSAITVTSTYGAGSGTDISGAGASDWMDCDSGNGIVTNKTLDLPANANKTLVLNDSGLTDQNFIPIVKDLLATAAEINQALDGISANVLAAALNILTGGGNTTLSYS